MRNWNLKLGLLSLILLGSLSGTAWAHGGHGGHTSALATPVASVNTAAPAPLSSETITAQLPRAVTPLLACASDTLCACCCGMGCCAAALPNEIKLPTPALSDRLRSRFIQSLPAKAAGTLYRPPISA